MQKMRLWYIINYLVGHFSYECRNYNKSKRLDKGNKNEKLTKEGK